MFFVIFRMFVGNVSKYFQEINRGIDSLVNEDAQDIALPAELASTERKINSIRHTLTKRKSDAELTEQRKNDLVMYLAHDLKTPLSSVIEYLTLLRDEGQISDELRERYLTISLDKAERLEDLINEFLLAVKNLKLEFEMQPDIFVSCDANKMQRVFDNLLRNAVSYCNADTGIKIIAE